MEALAFDLLPSADSLASVGSVEKLRGAEGAYKIRVGSYRVGLRVLGGTVVLERVLDRKDIYRVFP